MGTAILTLHQRPEDILSHIEPLSKRHALRYRFAVFFVTPSFARWLLDDSVFLQKALTNIYPQLLGPNTRPRIHALCAVVDRLPGPRPIADADNMMQEGFERLRNPPVQEIGHEGVAYATLPFDDSILTASAKDQVKAAISFVSAKGEEGEGADLSDAIRLPLANTVFQTGSPTTMTYSFWAKGKGAKELTLKEKRDVSHHGIRMQMSPGNHNSMLSVPLIPLSRPRLVEASMGNILRRITGPDGESITASQELEKFVPRFFSARGEPSQATTVWALVMDREVLAATQEWTDTLLEHAQPTEDTPTEDRLWENLWKSDPPVWNPLITHALASGARLHRVLSGGGGWGKKAGLLSLDPVPVPSSDSSEFDQLDGPGDLSDALQQVAREGDSIQFFISPSATPDASLPSVPNDTPVWGLELGTIPSTTDALPIAATQSSPGTNTITVYKNMFGALAEGGMVMSRSFKLDGESSYGLVGASTIDVPFTRFSAVNWVAEPQAGEDAEVCSPASDDA